MNGSARCWLTRPGDAEVLTRRAKVSFCLRDSYQLPVTQRCLWRVHAGQRQGLTRGWGDVYQCFLPDQSLTLPRSLTPGTYCLHELAHPQRAFTESDENDNASVRAVRIEGTKLRYGDSARCG